MQIPKFLIADSSEFPEKFFVFHTEYPRFLLDVTTDDVEWIDDLEEEEGVDLEEEVTGLLELAYEFFDKEMDSYEED